MSVEFCHLHVHSQYSLLDGASRIPELVATALAMGQPALAITDHGNLFGAIEFYKACQEATAAAKKAGRPGVKPILGLEAYIVPGGKGLTTREKIDGEYDHHCMLWAADAEGFRNLMKLSSLAYLQGFYMHPRVDLDLLASNAKGLLGGSGCLSSEIPFVILRRGEDEARRVAGRYVEIFGAQNFYFEIQNHCPGGEEGAADEEERELARNQRKVNQALLKLAREFGSPAIATNDSHYTRREDAPAHEALMCIGTGKLLRDKDRMKFPCDQFYMKSNQEMASAFPDNPEFLRATLGMAERCNVELKFAGYHYPVFPIPAGEGPEQFFRRLVEEGLRRRCGGELPGAVRQRADEELRVLVKMGLVGYLLIVWDIVRSARERGIPVGPGRGSAAGSIVCYALGITDLDPLKYGLLFERFVNEGRNEMPDIDIDFCQSRRGEVIEHIQQTYGRDCTAGIITFNTMAAKASIRDLGRVLDWPLHEVNRLAKLIPVIPTRKVTLRPRNGNGDALHVVDDEPEMKAEYQRNPKVRELINLARKIEGLVRNPGRHAAGVVIADRPIIECCPLCTDKDGTPLTQFEMSYLDSVGLLKIDVLGLETLTMLQLATRLVRERRDAGFDLARIPLDDPRVFEMLQRGESKGVFQFESEGMVRLLTEARPDCLEDLTALNAMYRPGPMQNIPAFISRKHRREKIEYLLPELEPILRETYGVVVYQEQVMQIANRLAGFSLSEADSLRKAMGKKLPELMARYGQQFVAGCGERGIKPQKAKELYELIAKFAEYGFNKSHSAAYALVAYRTAYLKAHYPAEFMAALLSLEQSKTEKVVEYIEEARRMGLEVKGPDVNVSRVRFCIEGGTESRTLRFSLTALKGVGEKAVEAVEQARDSGGPFRDLYDFCARVDSRMLNKGALESLVRAGAFDSLAGPGGRGQLATAVEEAMNQGAAVRRDKASGQGALFGEAPGAEAKVALPPVGDWPRAQRLEEEKKVLGFYLSGHPLSDVREFIEGLSTTTCRGLAGMSDGAEVVMGVYLTAVQPKVTRTDGRKMAVLLIEDFTGAAQAVAFPRAYERYRELMRPDQVLFLRGNVRVAEVGAVSTSVAAEEILSLEQALAAYPGALSLRMRQADFPVATDAAPAAGAQPAAAPAAWDERAFAARLENIVQLLGSHPGPVPVWFELLLEDESGSPARAWIQAGARFGVRPAPELLEGLRQLLPRDGVRVWRKGAAPFQADSPAARRAPPAAAQVGGP